MQFSRRTDWNLSANDLISTYEALKADGQTIINLTESNPTRCRFQTYQQFDLSVLSQPGVLSYQPVSQGLRAARVAIAEDYRAKGFDIDPENIFLTASTSEAYSFCLRLLANPQDRVLLPRPSYPLFDFIMDLNDVERDCYNLDITSNWFMDTQALQKAFSEKSKAVILVNPNNPTGSYISEQEARTLNTLCEQKGTAIICDEVFWDFDLQQDQKRFSFVTNVDVLTLTLGGFSKTLALPQMKLSWIIVNGPREQVAQAKQRLEVIADTYLSVNTPVQLAATAWFLQKTTVQSEIMQRLHRNLCALKKAFDPVSDVQVLCPQGGWYVVLHCGPNFSEDDFVINLLTKHHVLVYPGYFFDFAQGDFLVISLLLPEASFQEGVKHLQESLF